MSNKHMKRYSTLLVIGEMQNKFIMRYDYYIYNQKDKQVLAMMKRNWKLHTLMGM